MSFIYDNPWLVSQLLKAGHDFETKFLKRGQAAPAAPAPNQQYVSDALRALLDNLRDQIKPSQEGANQIGMGSGGSELASHNMDSMGDLVEWLTKNATRIGGKIISLPGNQEKPSDDYGYFKIEPGTEILTPLQRPDRTSVAYLINPTLLQQYLISLQADPKLKGNPIFQVQLLKLIQDVNTQLNLSISETYKEPARTVDDKTELDKIPNPLDPKSSPGVKGNLSLTSGDLKSLETFNSWMINNKLTLKSDKGTVSAGEDGFDQCGVFNALAARAKSHYTWRQNADSAFYAQYYWNQIAAVAREANCQISGQLGAGTSSDTSGATSQAQLLQQLITLRPFNTENISFPEIKQWLETYSAYANDANITALAQKINTAMDSFKNGLNAPMDTIQMNNLDTTEFKSMLKQPTDSVNMANYLHDIILQAGSLYQRMVNQLQNLGRDSRFADAYRLLASQVSAGGPQQTNKQDLEELVANLIRLWQQHR
jgi:hypothetical protein